MSFGHQIINISNGCVITLDWILIIYCKTYWESDKRKEVKCSDVKCILNPQIRSIVIAIANKLPITLKFM